MAGGMQVDRSDKIEIRPNTSQRIASFEKNEWLDPSDSAAFAVLSRDDEIVARNRLFLPMFRELKWTAADMRMHSEEGKLMFESDVFCWGVCLDLDGKTPLPDNFFDLYPGIPYSIPWTQAANPEVLRTGNLDA